MRTFKINAPIGLALAPEGPLSEKQLREFAIQINQNEEYRETWVEKIEKDEIESVIEWLEGIGYKVEAVDK